MEFNTMFWILLTVIGALGVLAFIFLFKSSAPMSTLPIGNQLFPRQNQNEYVGKRGVVMDTPNGKVRVRGVRISDADPSYARLLVANEFGEEYLLDAHLSNIAYEQNISDIWQVMCRPETALRWACNLDRTNQPKPVSRIPDGRSHEVHIGNGSSLSAVRDEVSRGYDGQKADPFSRLHLLEHENDMLRQRAEDALRMAADVASSGAEERKIIHQAEIAGIKKEAEYGDKNRTEILPQRMPIQQEDEEE